MYMQVVFCLPLDIRKPIIHLILSAQMLTLLLYYFCIYIFYLLRRPRPDLFVRDGFHLITLKIETPYKTAHDRNNRV